MSTHIEIKFFRGDHLTSEKPHVWFRKLEARFDEATTVNAKLYKFAKNLEPGGRAERWFATVPAADKATWELFYAAFTAKWPMPKTVEPTREELTERLNTLILPVEALGTLVDADGDKMYSHVAWAEDVRGIVNALDDPQGYLIPMVRGNLPLTIRMLLPSATGNVTWPVFLDNVSSLSLERLRDQLEWMGLPRQLPTPVAALTSRFAAQALSSTQRYLPAAPTHTPYVARYTQTQPATTPAAAPRVNTPAARTPLHREAPPHMSPWTPRTPAPATPATPTPYGRATPSTPTNPFYTASDRTLTGTSIFAKNTPATPQTPTRSGPSHADLASAAVARSVIYPDTAEGAAAYNAAMDSWNATYSPQRPADFTTAPYPLRPGTANIGARECFRCGLHGHIGSACPNLATQLDKREQDWRSLVSRCLYANPRNDGGTYRVSQISADDVALSYDPAIYDTAELGFEDTEGDQGNGEEERE